jgi:hypothetical protein
MYNGINIKMISSIFYKKIIYIYPIYYYYLSLSCLPLYRKKKLLAFSLPSLPVSIRCWSFVFLLLLGLLVLGFSYCWE